MGDDSVNTFPFSGYMCIWAGLTLLVTCVIGLIIYFCSWRQNQNNNDEISFKFLKILVYSNTGFWILLFGTAGYTLLLFGVFNINYLLGFWINVSISIVLSFLFCGKFLATIYKNIRRGGHNREKVLSLQNYYHDFSNITSAVVFIGVIQVAISIVYTIAISNQGEFEASFQTFWCFVLGAAVQFACMYLYIIGEIKDGQLRFWCKVHRAKGDRDNLPFKIGNEEVMRITTAQIWFRIFLDWSVNIFAQHLVVFLIPIHMAQSDKLQDVVLNIVAAYFVVELDNLRSDITMTINPSAVEDLVVNQNPMTELSINIYMYICISLVLVTSAVIVGLILGNIISVE
jgi:hypothetical protein